MSNGTVELIATLDVGLRVIRFSFIGGENEFKEYDAQLGQTGGKEWRMYGGHRLWHAPEDKSRTYFPDNEAVTLEQYGDFVRLIQPVETTTGMQKEIDLRLAADSARVAVVHRLRNTSPVPASAVSRAKLRACCCIQRASGWGVQPARWTRRVRRWIKISA